MRSAARSDPASGSLKPWHQTSSPRRIGGSQRARCSAVPSAAIVGPACNSPTKLAPTYGAPALSVSSRKIRRMVGEASQWTSAYPASYSIRCQPRSYARRPAQSSGDGFGAVEGSTFASHSRSRARNSSSAGL